jgi:hypothetical protein
MPPKASTGVPRDGHGFSSMRARLLVALVVAAPLGLACSGSSVSSDIAPFDAGSSSEAGSRLDADSIDLNPQDAADAACPSDDGGQIDAGDLVGVWALDGPHAVYLLTGALTLAADETFTLTETVAPLLGPPPGSGGTPGGPFCEPLYSYVGTYVVGFTCGAPTIGFTFTGGTDTTDCDAGATAIPAATIAANQTNGQLPTAENVYSITSTALVLTPESTAGGDTPAFTFTKPD